MSLTIEHCQQQIAETRRYLKTKGKPNRMHDLIRDQVVMVEWLIEELKAITKPSDGGA